MDDYENLRRFLELQASLDAEEKRKRDYLRFLQHEQDAARVHTEQLRSFLAMQEAYERTTKWLHDKEQIAESVQRMLAGLNAMERTKTLATEAASWDRLLRQEVAQRQQLKLLTAHAFSSWQASWQTMQNQLDLLTPALVRAVSGSALAPSLALSDFSRETIREIARAKPAADEHVKPLQASLVLAESQVEGTTKALSNTLGQLSESGPSGEQGTSGGPGAGGDGGGAATTGGIGAGGGGGGDREPPLRPTGGDGEEHEPEGQARVYATALFIAQRTELVNSGSWPEAPTATDIIARSPTAQTQRLADGIVRRIAAVNQTRRIKGHENVFTPTTRTMTATAELLLTNVGDFVSLGVVVDALWYLVYESSGALNRVLAFVDRKRCGSVFAFRHLRNKWLRHDVDHGSPKDQQDSWSARDGPSAIRG